MAVKKRRRAVTSPIDTACKKSDADFVKDYLEPGAPNLTPWRTEWTNPKTGQAYALSLARSTELGEASLEACYRLIEGTSRADYESSMMKWRPEHKRVEMRSPDLRYIVVRRVEDDGRATEAAQGDKDEEDVADKGSKPKSVDIIEAKGTKEVTNEAKDAKIIDDISDDAEAVDTSICAFTSLMPVYEEGEPVVYCYEIHLSSSLQGSGLGHILLGFQSIVAHNLGPPVNKVMLTCFLSNTRALKFYERQGFVTDALAPATRRLRGGKITATPNASSTHKQHHRNIMLGLPESQVVFSHGNIRPSNIIVNRVAGTEDEGTGNGDGNGD
ncbi:N alpha-acetyl-transferase [Sporothrix eucalyptigena]|uniref:N-alpha-acetyltransferase 40 n=1 Tax=Sporothrix eucalyptigena TaxID=1812306 RepID=A0ABP0CG93_9PEZI